MVVPTRRKTLSNGAAKSEKLDAMSANLLGFGSLLIIGAGLFAISASELAPDAGPEPRWLQHDNRRPKAPVVEPVASPASTEVPKDAIVLFDGKNLDQWQSATGGGPARWKVIGGYMEIVPDTGPIETKTKFGDVQLHVEWATPDPPAGAGQDRGNSGIFLMGEFELQVLDSYRADTYADGQAGAIYGQYPPLANASRPPGQWQTYDIAFRRPRFGADGKLLEPARVTLIHNGILVQNNESIVARTSWLESLPYEPQVDRGPLRLQDHNHPVRYRKIWVRELSERPAPSADALARPKVISLEADALEPFVGQYATESEAAERPMTISRGEGHLILKLSFRPTPLDMLPVSATEFILPRTYARFTFQRDGRGRVTGALFRIGDEERVLKKIDR
jgi:hypothetical protein